MVRRHHRLPEPAIVGAAHRRDRAEILQQAGERHRTGRRARRSGTLRGSESSRPTRSASAGSTCRRPIVDRDLPAEYGSKPLPIFESGVILLHLARKAGRFLPDDPVGRKETLERLFWQVGNLGPMADRFSHFVNYAPGDEAYSRTRYGNEYNRCIGVLERRLADRAYLVGEDYTIADMAS